MLVTPGTPCEECALFDAVFILANQELAPPGENPTVLRACADRRVIRPCKHPVLGLARGEEQSCGRVLLPGEHGQ